MVVIAILILLLTQCVLLGWIAHNASLSKRAYTQLLMDMGVGLWALELAREGPISVQMAGSDAFTQRKADMLAEQDRRFRLLR